MPSGLPNLPSINELLESPPLKSLVDRVNPTRMMTSVRSFVDGMFVRSLPRASCSV